MKVARTVDYQCCYSQTKSYRITQKFIVSFFADDIVCVAEFSQCAEYGIKHGKMQLHKIMNT
jgi:hypothetical protein